MTFLSLEVMVFNQHFLPSFTDHAIELSMSILLSCVVFLSGSESVQVFFIECLHVLV
jgi:hypothetical protein